MARAVVCAVVIDSHFAFVLVLRFDFREDRIQADGFLAWERKGEGIFEHTVFFTKAIVEVAIAHRARLRPLMLLFILARHVDDVRARPQMHVIEDHAGFWIASACVQHVQHS